MASGELKRIFARISSVIRAPSRSQTKILEKVALLAERLTTERFQLAVLGQFKRGKSSLLNALLGAPILPTGIIPVTAIPTFLRYGPTDQLRVTSETSGLHEISPDGSTKDALWEFVTEEGNPQNEKGISQVDVILRSPLLEQGVTLIDTPGVGSTNRHNTAAAQAVLPECDAALFVVSADPPITEVELEYLAHIKATVARIIVVLNKVDNLEATEVEHARRFLRRVLVEDAGMDAATPVFPLSARQGLAAKQFNDLVELKQSGLADLEEYLGTFLAEDKQSTLEDAIIRKTLVLLDDLQLEIQVESKSLQMPLRDLEQKIHAFDAAAQQFERESRAAGDLLAGDRQRVLQNVDEQAEELRAHGRMTLAHKFDGVSSSSHSEDELRSRLSKAALDLFDRELPKTVKLRDRELEAIFTAHERRSDDLVTQVRETAANLLEISLHHSDRRADLKVKRDPFWIAAAPNVTLNPIPAGAFDRVLPASMRQNRLRRRLLTEMDTVLLRNVENLRWATRQNINDSFRSFAEDLNERLAANLELTRGAMREAYARRREHSPGIESELTERKAALNELEGISADLRAFQINTGKE